MYKEYTEEKVWHQYIWNCCLMGDLKKKEKKFQLLTCYIT